MELKLCALAMVTVTVLLPLSMAQPRMAPQPGLKEAGVRAVTLDPVVVTPRPTLPAHTCDDLGGGDGDDHTGDTFDGQDFQLEPKEGDETEDMDDDAYERDLDVSEEDTNISEAELAKHVEYVTRRYPATSRDLKTTVVAELSPYHHYSIFGHLVMYRCCPRRQGYGCRSIRRRLGCFRKFGNQVCCPIWPRRLYTAYCNCHRCVRLTPTCATCGTCQRRYRSVRMWAVCRVIPNGFWNVRELYHPVATSCYCRTSGRFNPWATFTSNVRG